MFASCLRSWRPWNPSSSRAGMPKPQVAEADGDRTRQPALADSPVLKTGGRPSLPYLEPLASVIIVLWVEAAGRFSVAWARRVVTPLGPDRAAGSSKQVALVCRDQNESEALAMSAQPGDAKLQTDCKRPACNSPSEAVPDVMEAHLKLHVRSLFGTRQHPPSHTWEANHPEVTGSNPVPATEEAQVRGHERGSRVSRGPLHIGYGRRRARRRGADPRSPSPSPTRHRPVLLGARPADAPRDSQGLRDPRRHAERRGLPKDRQEFAGP
jgi:hypothetical protein